MSRPRKWPSEANPRVELRLTGEPGDRLNEAWQESSMARDNFEQWMLLAGHFYARFQTQRRRSIEAAFPRSASDRAGQ